MHKRERQTGIGRGTSYSNGRSDRARPTDKIDVTRTILISDLNKETIAATLLDYFVRFGQIYNVELLMNDDEMATGQAKIRFKNKPMNHTQLIGTHRIDGKQVKVVFTADTNNGSQSGGVRDYASTRLFPKKLAMGSLVKPKEYVEEWMTTENIHFNIRYTQRRVNISFSHLNKDYKMEFKFKDIYDSIKVEREGGTTILTIQLRYPALYWIKNHNHRKESKNAIHVGQWERCILIPLTPDTKLDTRPTNALSPIRRTDIVDIGKWLALRLTFIPGTRFAQEFDQHMREAAEFNLIPREDLGRFKPFITVKKSSDLPKPLDHVGRNALISNFDVLYSLESVISNNYFNEYNLTPEFYSDTLTQLVPSVSTGILNLIATGKQQCDDPQLTFARIFENMGIKVQDQRSIPSHCALLRKVIVTPSHFYIQPPSIETTNRVVRHYREHSDRFIRVQFMDEGFNQVGSVTMNSTQKEAIYNRIYSTLKFGIQIGKRRYEFLAFSSSQLREQGCWFFAPTEDLSAGDIRAWMGVFSHEKVVAKHAIRMGQCFSSTRPVCTLLPDEVAYIPDIKRGEYTFSDGVGKISPQLADEVAFQMEEKVVPSAFQFRLGGAKGVLTVDNSLTDKVKIQLRPSQIKFESKHLVLEVIRTSSFINGYLNRQVITLLSALGVKDEVFMELMDNMLSDINRMLSRPEEAIRVLLSNVDEAGTAVTMVPIIQAGFLERRDPYICNLLNLFRISMLKDLKKKAKINVPKGAYLLGVMDETNTLEEGEVFVQIYDTSHSGARREIITGEVVVFRNPCFHPGDVRVVKAVDYPNLHHLVDVVVFSSKGFRDIPSMCSGGDLDGDDYTVYWDPKLIPPIKNFSPMDYTAAPPKIVDNVKIRDILRFFVNYISYDNLGQIANAHLATADFSSAGARDGKCILLAQLHSEAVDFPKSGKPANMTDELIVKTFPDFMQKKDKPMYESKKVLGRIFRAIDKADYKEYQTTLTEETEYDPRMRVPGMELYIAEARRLRFDYNQDLTALMNQFGVQTEAEICSGYIIKWLKKGKSKTRYEQHEYTMKAVRNFKAHWKKEFEREFTKEKTIDYTLRSKIDAKAAAWYYVTYHPEERKRDITITGKFLSFPWCIHVYICEIAKRNTRVNDPSLTIGLDEEVIQEGAEKLLRDRGDGMMIMEASDDEEELYDVDYTSDNSSDDEVHVHNSSQIGKYKSVAHTAASASAIVGGNSPSPASSTLENRIGKRALEPHQSIVSSEATMDELADALLGIGK